MDRSIHHNWIIRMNGVGGRYQARQGVNKLLTASFKQQCNDAGNETASGKKIEIQFHWVKMCFNVRYKCKLIKSDLDIFQILNTGWGKAGQSCALEGLEFAGFHSFFVICYCCAISCVGNKAKWSENSRPEMTCLKKIHALLCSRTLGYCHLSQILFHMNQKGGWGAVIGNSPDFTPHLSQTDSEI